jgi:hypothetical protein
VAAESSRVQNGFVGNFDGRAQAITAFTAVKPGWSPWLRFMFWTGRTFPNATIQLRKLSFIHFARWGLVRPFPFVGDGQPANDVGHLYMLFESNFNGTWDEYIDAFAEAIPWQMRSLWWSSYGFPGPLPVEPFKDYIHRIEYEADHYWSAYPTASSTMIQGALGLEQKLAAFVSETSPVGAEEFRKRYNDFLTDVQGVL